MTGGAGPRVGPDAAAPKKQMLIRLFQDSLKKRPHLTNAIASGVISGAGDVLSQVAYEKRNSETYDFTRTVRFVVLASAYIAPALHVWFKLLERVKGVPKIVPLKRLAIDQSRCLGFGRTFTKQFCILLVVEAFLA
ncbi:Protein Mpv17 [Parelaphostrongylus tenuis]|uniref:Mitochondrial inner membrane protein Mpv17 n=1 Tax=Parelaphostrongylus tenuis TaxID=148309 RepID=A0AAD5QWV9_PARTN|nr:Protein Mpv17 [Parelaphostrongylus tenuis]